MTPFAGARAILELKSDELPRELFAGLTLAALMVPLNIGYAQIAGLPAQVGLYAAIVPCVGYALLSTSRHLVASPDAVVAALVASSLAGMAAAGSSHYVALAAAQAFVCGLVFLVLWAFRLGFLADFLSRAVLVGFLAGLGVEVFTSQVEKILGYHVEAPGFLRETWALVTTLPQANVWSVSVGLGAIAVMLAVGRWAPKWPGPLVALALTTVAVVAFRLDGHGVKVLGDVSAGLPRLAFPKVSLAEWVRLIPGAIAITGVTVAEGLLLARSMARKHEEELDDDTELLGYGAANVLAGFAGTFAIGSSASRTVTIERMKPRTQLPTLVAAAVVALAVVFFSDVLAVLPEPALAGIVAVAVLGLIDVAQLRYLFKTRPSEFWIAVVCMSCVLLFGPLIAVFVAFALSAVDVVRRLSSPETTVLVPSDDGATFVPTPEGALAPEAAEGVVVYRFGAPLQFSNAKKFFSEAERLTVEGHLAGGAFVIDLQAVSDIDSTGAETFEQVGTMLAERDIRVALTRVSPRVLGQLELYGLFPPLDRELIFDTNRKAVEALGGGRAS